MTEKFGFTLKIFYNKVMSILDRVSVNKDTTTTQKDHDLSKQDIEMLLALIKESTFKGEHIETLYALVYKLQQQYLQKK